MISAIALVYEGLPTRKKPKGSSTQIDVHVTYWMECATNGLQPIFAKMAVIFFLERESSVVLGKLLGSLGRHL